MKTKIGDTMDWEDVLHMAGFDEGLEIDFNPRVHVWMYDHARERWVFEVEQSLADCFDVDDEEVLTAAQWLHTHDAYTVGGGAAPLFKLVRI